MMFYQPANLVFDTPEMERAFSDYIRQDWQVGGHLIVSHWHPQLTVRQQRKYEPKVTRLTFIHDWVIVPNETLTPTSHYMPGNWKSSLQQVSQTMRSKRQNNFYWSIPFRTQAAYQKGEMFNQWDATVALKHFPVFEKPIFSEYAIAASYPFRLIAYTIEQKTPDTIPIITPGNFLSWRSRALDLLRQELLLGKGNQ